ncbi:MAG: hypothetical protein M3081_03790 [Gemmatimonadota bacterium]|nr:hypothetical protein [Gemmatimonadota bacterium]
MPTPFRTIAFGAAFLLATTTGLHGQSAPPVITRDSARTLDRYMSPEELRATGVRSLTSAQRAALDAWLQHYTELVLAEQVMRDSRLQQEMTGDVTPRAESAPRIEPARGENAPPPRDDNPVGRGRFRPTSVPGLVRIASVIDGGDAFRLDDGTSWSINPSDRPTTTGWHRGDKVAATVAPVSAGEYNYVLTNATDGSKALAKVGTPRP